METSTRCWATLVLERDQPGPSGRVRSRIIPPGERTDCEAQLSNWEEIWQDWLDGKPWCLLVLPLCNVHHARAEAEARRRGLVW